MLDRGKLIHSHDGQNRIKNNLTNSESKDIKHTSKHGETKVIHIRRECHHTVYKYL